MDTSTLILKMQAIFIALGLGVSKGVRLDAISNLDVAPTIAALLGFEMKARGHPIDLAPAAIRPILCSSWTYPALNS